MARVIEAEARISAVDATGNTFENIASKVKGLASSMKALGGAASSNIAGVNRTIGRLQGAINTLAPIASGAAAMEGMRGVRGLIHEVVKSTAERAHEAVRMEAAGMSEAEIADAETRAGEMSGRYKALNKTTIMHALRNMRAVVGTYEEAQRILEPILQMRIVAMGAHPERSEELNEDFDKLVKGMEIKGVTMDPEKFKSYINTMTKSLDAFSDTMRPTDFYEMFKYGRQATQGLSEQFMLETGPTLANELGGSSAGKAMSSFFQSIVGGRIKEQSVKELDKLGLIDRAHVVQTKTGSIKGLLPGGVKGWELASHDPYAWVNDMLLPALHKHGISKSEDVQAVIGTIFQQATAAQMAGIFATQQPRIEKDWNLVRGARGTEAWETFMRKDPFIAMQGVTAQFGNLLAIAGSPLAGPAAENLNKLAGAIVAIENATNNHPWAATAGVGAGIGLLGTGSLAASMWALRSLFGWGRNLASVAGVANGGEAAAAAASSGGWLASVLGPAGLMMGAAGLMSRQSSDGGPTAYGARGTSGFGIGPVLLDALRSFTGNGGAPPHWSTSDIRSAIEGRPAEVKGSADLNVSVRVEPSDSFISSIISAIRNEINVFSGANPGGGVGTTGSTGLSMPETLGAP
jgi:hypothetical protein